ncbi:MAG: DNA alkylation repair protein, partial [Candidatus Hermodarchaeota archaeon]
MTLKPDIFLSYIDAMLREHVDPALSSYFTDLAQKSSYQLIGVRAPHVRQIANTSFREFKAHSIKDIDSILNYCDYLLAQRVSEYRTIAFQWSFKCKKQFQPKHFEIFERWLKTYVTGWGSCDDFCTHTLGHFLLEYPEFIPQVKVWTSSNNNWIRRASAVIFIYAIRRGEYLAHIFEVADKLLNDSDIYVLKGYGWMLKEASNLFQNQVFQYVVKHKDPMPRVSLRLHISRATLPRPTQARTAGWGCFHS